MTTIRIPVSTLKTPALLGSKFTDKSLEILKQLFFTVIDDAHYLVATDLKAYFAYQLLFPPIGKFGVDAKAFTTWLRKFRKDDMLEMSFDGQFLTLSTERYEVTFKTNTVDDMPILRTGKAGTWFKLRNVEPLLTASATTDGKSPSLCGVTVQGNRLMASNGFRAHFQEIETENHSHYRIPYPLLKHLKGDVLVALNEDQNYVSIKQGPVTISGNAESHAMDVDFLDGYFRDVDWQPVPNTALSDFAFLRSEVCVRLDKSGVVTCDRHALAQARTRTVFPIQDITVNPTLVFDALRFVGLPAQVALARGKYDRPLVFESSERRAVVMPMSINL